MSMLARIRPGTGESGFSGPADIPLTTWRRIAVRAWRNGRKDNLNVLAGGIAFYAFFALIPFLAAIATIYGPFARQGRVAADIGSVLSILPGDATRLLADRVDRFLADNMVGPPGLILALLLAAKLNAEAERQAALTQVKSRSRAPALPFVG